MSSIFKRKSKKDKGKPIPAGHKLEDYPQSNDHPIPAFVEQCVEYLKKHEGLKAPGIYKAPGEEATVQNILKTLGGFPEDQPNVKAVADAFKQFVRQLEEPLIPASLQGVLNVASWRHFDDLSYVYTDFRIQSDLNYRTFVFIIHHLNAVATQQDNKNPEIKMNAQRLAEVWAPSLVGRDLPMDEIIDQIRFTIQKVENLLPLRNLDGRLGCFRLEEYPTDQGLPMFITQCVEYIEKDVAVIQAQRIYHYTTPGAQRSGEQLAPQMKNPRLTSMINFDDAEGDVYAVPEALKKFIRELQEPLIPELQQQAVITTGNLQELQDLFRKIEHYNGGLNHRTLAYLFNHLKRVAAHKPTNEMGPKELAEAWVSTLYANQNDDKYLEKIAPLILTKSIEQADQLFPN